jgi:hypothetical protein
MSDYKQVEVVCHVVAGLSCIVISTIMILTYSKQSWQRQDLYASAPESNVPNVPAGKPRRYIVFDLLYGNVVDIFDDIESATEATTRIGPGGHRVIALPVEWTDLYVALSGDTGHLVYGMFPTYKDAFRACKEQPNVVNTAYVYHYQLRRGNMSEP